MTRIQQVMSARMDRIRKGDSEKGFTLIELLVVIIIIGILAAIAVPVFLNVREGAWKSSVESDVHNAQLAIEQYAINNNGSTDGASGTATADAPLTITANGTSQTINASDGNSVVIAATATGYTITATNSNYGTDAGHTYTFTSATGKGTWP